MPEDHITDIARTIQLAVAPVFLLMALGTLLGVLTNRLARVVDRARVLVTRPADAPIDSVAPNDELVILERRRRLVNGAITCAVFAALLVCLVIAAAFIAFMLERDLSALMAWLFIGAMASSIAALGFFLREIFVTMSALRIRR
jgi:hypothetical protein